MTITLTYTVDDERDERYDATRAINVVEYANALWNIEQELRRLEKYGKYEYGETHDMISRLRKYVRDVVAALPGYDG